MWGCGFRGCHRFWGVMPGQGFAAKCGCAAASRLCSQTADAQLSLGGSQAKAEFLRPAATHGLREFRGGCVGHDAGWDCPQFVWCDGGAEFCSQSAGAEAVRCVPLRRTRVLVGRQWLRVLGVSTRPWWCECGVLQSGGGCATAFLTSSRSRGWLPGNRGGENPARTSSSVKVSCGYGSAATWQVRSDMRLVFQISGGVFRVTLCVG